MAIYGPRTGEQQSPNRSGSRELQHSPGTRDITLKGTKGHVPTESSRSIGRGVNDECELSLGKIKGLHVTRNNRDCRMMMEVWQARAKCVGCSRENDGGTSEVQSIGDP